MKSRIHLFVFFALMVLSVPLVDAKTTRPSSGRRLSRGHWLTCWGGDGGAYRHDPDFHRDTSEETVAAYVPEFKGRYAFEVKDTWEEWVTHSGESCAHCGETCTGKGENRTCTCNTCSWQELETFYRPWSTQVVDWHIKWNQSQEYRNKRQAWIKAGSPDMARDADDVNKLLEFDPDRPLEYYLFPGESEYIRASNSGGFFGAAENISPHFEIEGARHKYSIYSQTNRGAGTLACDDVDLKLEGTVTTGKRLITITPNSIRFNQDWVMASKNHKGDYVEEPGAFEITDVSALRYENQNVFDHYKDTKVEIWLRQIDRAWWFDRNVSASVKIGDNRSTLKDDEQKVSDDGSPRVATFEIPSKDLFKTPLFGSSFHLKPGKRYEVCTRVFRDKNIYYKKTWGYFWTAWSEKKCAVFSMDENMRDMRSGGRKFRDWTTRVITLPWW